MGDRKSNKEIESYFYFFVNDNIQYRESKKLNANLDGHKKYAANMFFHITLNKNFINQKI
jgi:hypothetical protein